MIEYEYIKDGKIAVFLDGKRVGNIFSNEKGWIYRTKDGRNQGEWFKTLEECKKSLEQR